MSNRIIIISVLALLVTGSIYSAWLFLKNDISVTLSEGQVYYFKDYEIEMQGFNPTTCVEILDFVCKKTVSAPNVTLKVSSPKQKRIDFLNLGEVYGLSGEIEGLLVSQKEIDLESRTVELILKRI